MAKTIAIVGAGWGDEGKGAVVSDLAREAQGVGRFQGGNNAGHTLYDSQGRKVVVNIAPSGVIYPHVQNIIGNGCVIDLEVLDHNLKDLINDPKLLISDGAHLIFDYHKQLDQARENSSAKIGTTKRGTGPAYADKINRLGIRASLLRRPKDLEEQIREAANLKNEELELWDSAGTINADILITKIRPLVEKYRGLVADASLFLDKFIKAGNRFIFEGAQGALLDIDHGTYPHVTSSSTTVAGLLAGAGLGLKSIDVAVGVAKLYCSRVGEGSFPTEGESYGNIKNLTRDTAPKLTLDEKIVVYGGIRAHPDYNCLALRLIQEQGDEFGATTGRMRRTGWLDIVALKKAIRVNGLDWLVGTRIDTLDRIGTVKVCTHYQNKETGEFSYDFPGEELELEQMVPQYFEFPGWMSTTGVRAFDRLPRNAQDYLSAIEGLTGVKFAGIRNGPRQGDYIQRTNLWRL